MASVYRDRGWRLIACNLDTYGIDYASSSRNRYRYRNRYREDRNRNCSRQYGYTKATEIAMPDRWDTKSDSDCDARYRYVLTPRMRGMLRMGISANMPDQSSLTRYFCVNGRFYPKSQRSRNRKSRLISFYPKRIETQTDSDCLCSCIPMTIPIATPSWI